MKRQYYIFIFLLLSGMLFSCNKTKNADTSTQESYEQPFATYDPFVIEEFNFKRFTVEDGLSSNDILALHCDQFGRMWIGTDNGLICYDGKAFEWYVPGKPNSENLTDKHIQDIESDSKGNLWILSGKRNLYKYDIINKKFSHQKYTSKTKKFNSSSSPQFLSLMIDSKDRIWINRYCSYFDQKLKKFFYPDSISYNYETFFEEKDTIFAIVTAKYKNHNHVIYFDENKNQFIDSNSKRTSSSFPYSRLTHQAKNLNGDIFFSDQQSKCVFKLRGDDQLIAIDSFLEGGTKKDITYDPVSDAFWLATWQGGFGIAKLDSNNHVRYRYIDPKGYKNVPHVPTISIAEDNSGNIWMGTYGEGIYIFTPFEDNVIHYSKTHNSNGVLQSEDIQCFSEFNDTLIIIGTKNGLFTFNPLTKHFSDVPLIKQYKLCSDNWVSGIVPYDKNNVLVSIYGGAILLFNPITKAISHPKLSNYDLEVVNKRHCFWIKKMERYGDNVLMNYWGGGLFILDMNKKTMSRIYNTKHQKVLSTSLSLYSYLDKSSKLWVSNTTGNSLDIFDFSGDRLNGNITYNLPEDTSYNIPVIRYSSENKPKGLRSFFIQKILEDSKGRMWLGTASGLHLRDSLGHFTPFGFKEGFPSEYIYDITQGPNKFIWITTKLGLIKFDPDSKEIIKFYNPKNTKNLQGSSFSANNSLLSKDGSLYFGGSKGFNIIQPSKLKNKYKPSLHIDKVLADEREVEVIDSTIIFEDGTKSISLEFLNSDILSNSDVLYNHRLSGKKNIDFNDQKTGKLILNNLIPGDYTLFSSSFNTKSGMKSYESQIYFSKKKSYWKTLWFLILSTLIIAYIAFLIFKRRLNLIHKRQKQDLDLQYLKIQNLQTQLHPHFIFNVLGAIQNLILGNKPQKANENLIKLKKLMRNFLDASVISSNLEDNASNETVLKKEIELLQMYIDFELLKSRDGFDIDFIISKDIDSMFITIPPLILQPFVENAIEHGLLPLEDRRGELSIKFSLEKEELICEIKDDGIGRKAAKTIQNKYKKSYKSRGTELVKKRIELLNERGAKIELQTFDLEQGTKVNIKFS